MQSRPYWTALSAVPSIPPNSPRGPLHDCTCDGIGDRPGLGGLSSLPTLTGDPDLSPVRAVLHGPHRIFFGPCTLQKKESIFEPLNGLEPPSRQPASATQKEAIGGHAPVHHSLH